MKVFIFGAGASAASQIDIPQGIHSNVHSPLVNNLFDDKYRIFGNMFLDSSVNSLLQEASTSGIVEKYLTDRWEGIKAKNGKRFQDAEKVLFAKTTFYIWAILQKVSNTYDGNNLYRTFLEKLKKKQDDFGLISFNYDTLLDRAYAEVFGVSFNDIGTYFEHQFFKPHGSVNWLLQKRQIDPGTNDLDFDVKIHFQNAASNMYTKEPINFNQCRIFNPVDDLLNHPESIFRKQDYFYPLLFLPLTTKLYETVSNFEQDLIGRTMDLMQRATQVYLIGYRASDKIIHEIFEYAVKKPSLYVVDKDYSESVKIMKFLTNKHILTFPKPISFDGGFQNFVDQYDSLIDS